MLKCLLSIPQTPLKVEVRVYRTQDAMYRAVKKMSWSFPNVTPEIGAYCEGTPKLIPKGYLAVVFFCEEYLYPGIIAHEFLHAASYLMYRKGIRKLWLNLKMASSDEEYHAGVMEELIERFTVKLDKWKEGE